MHKAVSLLSFLFFWFFAEAQHPGYSHVTDLNAFINQFSAASQKIQTIQSEFVQEKSLSMLSEKIVSKGKFWFKKDKMVRMEYTEPYQFLVIINKGNAFIRDGQKENKFSSGSNNLIKQITGLMLDCIQGTALRNPDFSVKLFENIPYFLVELTPKAATLKELFTHIDILIDKNDYSAAAIEMHELSGDNTSIHFNKRQINNPIPDALFHFI